MEDTAERENKAYTEGYEVGLSGVVKCNPYRPGTACHQAWEEGRSQGCLEGED